MVDRRTRSVVAAILWSALGADLPRASAASLPYLVKDTDTIGNGGGVAEVVRAGSRVFFRGYDPSNGEELWVSDGTAAGTQLVKDIWPGPGDSQPVDLTAVGNRIFFTAQHPLYGQELWVSDGTAAGTTLACDVTPGPNGSNLQELTPFGNNVCFQHFRTGGHDLWCSDGTPAGSVMLTTAYPFNTATGIYPAAAGSRLFFSGYDAAHGRELWATDGTPGGTARVADIYPGALESDPRWLTGLNGRVYFNAFDGAHGRELWTSDGTAGGTTQLRDIYPGPGASDPVFFTKVGNLLYFNATEPATGGELWVTDGTPAGTMLVSDTDPGIYSGGASYMAVFGSSVLFMAGPMATGAEPWISDGTAAGTMLLADIVPGPGGSFASLFADAGGRAFFSADEGGGVGAELWSTDGTPAGTARVTDIYPGSDSNGALSSAPSWITGLAGVALFSANDGVHGRELWRSDGTAAGTQLVYDVNPATRGGFYRIIGRLGDLMFFVGRGPSDLNDPLQLWRSDGTAAGTFPVGGGTALYGQPIGPAVALDGWLYFADTDDATGNELWRTDGTPGGTQLVANIAFQASNSAPQELTSLGHQILFRASERFGDTELYRSDGTEAGTFQVADIFPGGGSSAGGSSYPTDLTAFGNFVYFSADDGVHGRELWRSNGTTAGTTLVSDIHPSAGSSPSDLTVLGGLLYFIADDGVHGRELWKTDGSASGTALAVDIRAGGMGSNGVELRAWNGLLFLFADDGAHGLEPWRSDGTDAGTFLLSNLASYGFGSYPGGLARTAVIGETVFFTAGDSLSTSLFATDGTVLGTRLLRGNVVGGDSSNPDWLTPVGGSLYFVGRDGEIWQTDGTNVGTEHVTSFADDYNYGDVEDLLLVGSRLLFSLYTPLYGTEPWALDVGEACNAAPRDDCRQAGTTLLSIKRTGGERDKLTWKWLHGEQTGFAQLSDPTTNAEYAFCVYSGAPGSYLESLRVPVSASAWRALGTRGWKYSDDDATADGVRSLILKGGPENHAKALLRGRGDNLPDTNLGAFTGPLTVQLVNPITGLCLEARYAAADIMLSTPERLEARTP